MFREVLGGLRDRVEGALAVSLIGLDGIAVETLGGLAGLNALVLGRSNIVGTYYRSPNPESPAFVNVGDRVTKGKVLCIIEAMKLMNEIESDVDGRISVIYPQNGQPVEYGEKLFGIETS